MAHGKNAFVVKKGRVLVGLTRGKQIMMPDAGCTIFWVSIIQIVKDHFAFLFGPRGDGGHRFLSRPPH